ncbi:hypothetical protein A4A49_20209 [Nicotiana attenuata]|uniref:ATP-dependent DNA helicase n=1 Tax=Nicotiana attenuata TaxID=49451 RepID=A0A1J6J3G9_NICAT|nr:hypothetical protein A4A49_20209 [Nicotiana attenuata]
MGRDINEFELISEIIKPSATAKEAKDVHFERNIIVSEQDLMLENKLNIDQRRAYNMILDRIFSNRPGAFFIDGPGGTGKSFLYRALLATVRHKGFIALATASSGVAASLLPGGRTAHSCFKIPIDVNENFSCNSSKQSSLASLIRDAKLIVWDKISVAKKETVEAIDLLLRDLMETNIIFGGKVVVFSGSVMVVPFEDEIIAISNIQAQPQGQVFYVEAELSLPNENQQFCVLACSDCKQLFTRSFSRRTIYCTNCQRSAHLIPRCQFEVTVRDNSGFATAIISDKPAEKMLCLSSEEIYDIYHVKKQILPLADVQKQLSGKIFKIQMKKLLTKYHDTVQKLSILSYMNKDNEIHQEFPPTMMDVAEGSKRKIERLGLEGREAQETTNKDSASYYKRGLEIRTPPLKK